MDWLNKCADEFFTLTTVFVSTCLLVYLLLPSLISFAKDMLDGISDGNKCGNGNVLSKKTKLKILRFYAAFDRIIFCTTVYSLVCAFVGLIAFLPGLWIFRWAAFGSIVIYFLVVAFVWWLWLKSKRERKSTKGDNCITGVYPSLLLLLSIGNVVCIIAEVLCKPFSDSLHKEVKLLVMFIMGITLFIHLFLWLVPFLIYRPIEKWWSNE